MDFSKAEGDRIDLSMIDANALKFGDQSFSFEGSGDGWSPRGQLDYRFINGDTHIFGNIDRDKYPDFYMKLEGIVDIEASDFIL